jgi:3-phenylpropionate/cinnamic acid dioxygenase small subunit
MNDDPIRAELEIRRLVAQLAYESDAGELDDYLALFTDDAVWEMPGDEALGISAAYCAGQAEISDSVRQRRAIGVQGPGAGTMHHITTQRIDVSGDDGSGHIYYQFVGMVDGKPTIRTIGEYRDRYRRTAHGWKLAHRSVLIHWS